MWNIHVITYETQFGLAATVMCRNCLLR